MGFEFWAPVGAFLGGQIALIVVEWARHRLARKQRRQDARDDFQRQSLIELQEALYRLVRALSNAIHEYKQLRANKPLPTWPVEEDPRIIGAGVHARIDALAVRVDDEVVRRLVQEYLDKHAELSLESEDASLERFESQLKELRNVQKRANRRIGRLLQQL